MSRHAVASAAFGDLYGWLAAPNPLETRWPRDVPEVLAELRPPVSAQPPAHPG